MDARASSALFQFALPRGERLLKGKFDCLKISVSIRAPAWGATYSRVMVQGHKTFQFALPRGERHISAGI